MGKFLSALFWASSLVAPCSWLWADDAVAIGYNAEGVWTAVTYYCSSTPKGSRDYKTEKEAQQSALRPAKESILSASDSTGFVAVARGTNKSGKDVNVVGRGETQSQADKEAFAQLSAAGAGAKQKIVYRYFSYGADSAAKP